MAVVSGARTCTFMIEILIEEILEFSLLEVKLSLNNWLKLRLNCHFGLWVISESSEFPLKVSLAWRTYIFCRIPNHDKWRFFSYYVETNTCILIWNSKTSILVKFHYSPSASLVTAVRCNIEAFAIVDIFFRFAWEHVNLNILAILKYGSLFITQLTSLNNWHICRWLIKTYVLAHWIFVCNIT